jgi:hypothetical protein
MMDDTTDGGTMPETQPYATLVDSPLVSLNMIDHVLSGRMDQLDKKGRGLAARLYFLTAMFPQLPAGVLLALVEGDGRVTMTSTPRGRELHVHDTTLLGGTR